MKTIPRLAEIDAEIASLSVRKAKAMLNGDASMDLDLNAAIRDRSQERAALFPCTATRQTISS